MLLARDAPHDTHSLGYAHNQRMATGFQRKVGNQFAVKELVGKLTHIGTSPTTEIRKQREDK